MTQGKARHDRSDKATKEDKTKKLSKGLQLPWCGERGVTQSDTFALKFTILSNPY